MVWNRVFVLFILFIVAMPVMAGGYTFDMTPVIIESGHLLKYDSINIETGGEFTNRGTIIATDFNVKSGAALEIENSGTMNVQNFNVSDGASIVQVITSNESARRINNLDNVGVVVRDGNALSLNKISDAVPTAKSVTFENVIINVDDVFDNTNTFVIFNDTVTLNLLPEFTLPDDGIIFHHVTNTGRIIINTDNSNPMFVWDVTDGGASGAVYARSVRETDYSRFMSADVGNFLNSLRGDARNSKFMARLDAARNMDQINDIMSHSAHMNPIRLMSGIDMLHTAMALDLPERASGNIVTARPFALIGDNADLYGTRAGVMFNLTEHFGLGAHVHAAVMNYVDDMDEYAANMFGGGVNINWDDGVFVIRMASGMTISRFDIDAVYDNGRVYETPIGYSSYVMGDYGVRINLSDNKFILPTIGFNAVHNTVAASSETDFHANAGMDFGINGATYDVKYLYALRGRVFADGATGIGARIGLGSDVDGIGGDISIMRVMDKDTAFTEISAMLHILF